MIQSLKKVALLSEINKWNINLIKILNTLTLAIIISSTIVLQYSIVIFASVEINIDTNSNIVIYNGSLENSSPSDLNNQIPQPQVEVSIERTQNYDKIKAEDRNDKLDDKDGSDILRRGGGGGEEEEEGMTK